MRILYMSTAYWPFIGGMETHAETLVTGLRARGHDVIVATSRGVLDLPDTEEREGVPIHRFSFHEALDKRDPVLFLRAQQGLMRLKQQFRADVVHMNPSDATALFHLRTAAAYPSKLLVSMHIGIVPELCSRGTVIGAILRSADRVTTVSKYQLGKLREYVPEVSETSSVIFNGANMPACTPAQLPLDEPRLLCIGRLLDGKGMDVAIDAVALLASQWPTARLVIAGDGPEREALEARARSHGLSDRVEFSGWVRPQEIASLINTSTMVLVPSKRDEAFGLVALEAAQMARPVIASRVGGLPEVVEDGVTGVLIGAENAALLADAIHRLLAQPVLAIQLGTTAREHARLRFSGHRCVDEYEKVYRDLIGEEKHAAAE